MIQITGIIGNESDQYSLVKLIQDVKSQPETEPVHIMINSPGGDGELAFDMHDHLRSLGRQITTECTGQCASAASIIFLAGDRRIAGCPIMIHNPWIKVQGDAEQLKEASIWIADFEKRCEKFYSEKTGTDETTLSNLMKNNTYMSPSEAVALNFATEARQTAMAMIKTIQNINNQKVKNMAEKTKEKKDFLSYVMAYFSEGKEEPKVKMMDLTTAAGETVTIDREGGEPQVGDTASPDGSFVMPDGSTIVVANGVITEITPAQQPDSNGLEQLKAENAQLKEQLAAANAKAKTQDEAAQLNAIKIAGGTEWLMKQASTYKPQSRAAKPVGKPEQEEVENVISKKLSSAKEMRAKMYETNKK